MDVGAAGLLRIAATNPPVRIDVFETASLAGQPDSGGGIELVPSRGFLAQWGQRAERRGQAVCSCRFPLRVPVAREASERRECQALAEAAVRGHLPDR